jgi:hypothetical protein
METVQRGVIGEVLQIRVVHDFSNRDRGRHRPIAWPAMQSRNLDRRHDRRFSAVTLA